MSNIEIQPSNRGAFKPGQSGNPGGRPKTAKTITDSCRKLIEAGNGEKIAKSVLSLALNAKQEAVRIKAAEFLRDGLEGRPMQAIAMMQVMDDNTANRLIQVAQAFMNVSCRDGSMQSESVRALSAHAGQKSE